MNKERKALINSMGINFIVSATKISTGVLCNSKSIVADGFHSLSDFITDIVAYFGSKPSNKRADKRHPDGYGRTQYLIDLFIATVILFLGISTIWNSFQKETTTPNILWISVILFTIILKQINARYLMQKGKELHSPILITSAKETHDDVTSSIGVILVLILSQFSKYIPILKYIDRIGSVFIGLLILKTSFELYKENFNYLMGQTEKNEEIIASIKEIVNGYNDILYKDMDLEAHGRYYVLELEIYFLHNHRIRNTTQNQKAECSY